MVSLGGALSSLQCEQRWHDSSLKCIPRGCWLLKIYGLVGCCTFEVSLYSGTYS